MRPARRPCSRASPSTTAPRDWITAATPKRASRALWSALLAAERRLRALGVQELAQKSALVTAEEARRLLHSGLPVTGRLTPLARDVLEGRA